MRLKEFVLERRRRVQEERRKMGIPAEEKRLVVSRLASCKASV